MKTPKLGAQITVWSDGSEFTGTVIQAHNGRFTLEIEDGRLISFHCFKTQLVKR